MKLNKQTSIALIIGGICLTLYNVVLFVIAGFALHTATFWISYGAMMVAAIACGIALLFFTKKDKTMCDWFLGFPIFKHSVIYIILEFITSTTFILLDWRVHWAIPFVIQVIFFTVYVILVLSCLFTKTIINDIEKNVKTKTTFIRLLQTDAAMLAEMCNDPVAKKEFALLAEEIRYSDPMSNEILASLEGQIQHYITDAKFLLGDNDIEGALKSCSRARLLLKERNMKCKVLK